MPIDREELKELAKEAQKAQGYSNLSDLDAAIFEILKPADSPDLKSRAKVAIKRDKVMASAYSLVDHPSEIEEDDPDGEQKRLLYGFLDKQVWDTTKPLTGRMQRYVETHNGHVVCRLGGLQGESVYITADPDCFRVDVIESRGGKDISSVTTLAQFYARTSRRLPGMAPMIAEAFDASLQGMLAAGRAHLPLLQQGGSEGSAE